MEKKVISYDTHTITLHFGYNNNPWTEEDEALMLALVGAYDDEAALDKTVQEMFTGFWTANKRINNCRAALKKLTAAIDTVLKQADNYGGALGYARPASFDAFEQNINRVADRLERFDKPLRRLDGVMDGLLTSLNKWIEYTNQIGEEDTPLAIITHRHIQNYQNNSIDITLLVQEEDKLAAFRSVNHDRRKSCVDSCDDIYHDYELLVMEITVQYTKWEEFLKRYRLLCHIFREAEFLPTVSLN